MSEDAVPTMEDGGVAEGETTDREDSRRKDYLDRRRELEDIIGGQRDALDRWILTLSAGTFGLSVALANVIGSEQRWILLMAWIVFLVAIVLSLSSFAASIRANVVELKIDSYMYRNEVEESPGNSWQTVVRVLNALAFITFILGLAVLTWYAAVNL